MNLHPLLVHFPIALLTLYAVLELGRKFLKQDFWFYVKAVLVVCGVTGAGMAILSGLLIESQFSNATAAVELHSHIQEAASFFFGLLAVGYSISWLQRYLKIDFGARFGTVGVWAAKYEHLVLETPVVYLLTLLAMTLIFVGSALGGAIAFGANVDPFTQIIYGLLVNKFSL